MKLQILLIAFLLFIGCAPVQRERFETDTEEKYMQSLPGLAPATTLKIVKMTKLSFIQSEYSKKPCNPSVFMSEFVGKEFNTNKGKIRIDNIVDLIIKESIVTGYDGNNIQRSKKYACTYSGYGVEYDFSDIEIVTIKKSPKKRKNYDDNDDENGDDE